MSHPLTSYMSWHQTWCLTHLHYAFDKMSYLFTLYKYGNQTCFLPIYILHVLTWCPPIYIIHLLTSDMICHPLTLYRCWHQTYCLTDLNYTCADVRYDVPPIYIKHELTSDMMSQPFTLYICRHQTWCHTHLQCTWTTYSLQNFRQ